MNPVLLTALGSGHGDDGVGWLVAELLRQKLAPSLPVRILTCDRTGTEWLNQLRQEHRLVLVDAVRTGGRPGSIVHLPDLRDLPLPPRVPQGSCHGLTLPLLLGLARTLDILPPQVEFWGVEITSVEPGAPMARNVMLAGHSLVDRLHARLSQDLGVLARH